MKRVMVMLMVGTFAFVLAGCGGGDTETAAPATSAPAPAEPPATEPVVAPEPEPAPAAAGSIAGTSWKIDEFEIAFKEDGAMVIKGGPLAAIMPNGAPGTYKIEGGQIEVSAVGQTKRGTWDGEKLIVDGIEAEKVEATASPS